MAIEIRKATTAQEREQFLQVLRSANDRMAKKNIVQWLPCHLTAEAVFEPGVEPYLLFSDGIPAATALLVTCDPVFWPEKEPGSAVYIHRLPWRKAFPVKGWRRKCCNSPLVMPGTSAFPVCGWTAVQTGTSCGLCMKGSGSVLSIWWKWTYRASICAMPGMNIRCKGKGEFPWEKSMCWMPMWRS